MSLLVMLENRQATHIPCICNASLRFLCSSVVRDYLAAVPQLGSFLLSKEALQSLTILSGVASVSTRLSPAQAPAIQEHMSGRAYRTPIMLV